MNARMSYRLDVGPASDGSVSSLLPVLRSLHAVAHRNDAFTFDLVARDGHVAVYVTCPSSRASHLV